MKASTIKAIALAIGYLFVISGCSKPAPPPHALDDAKDSARAAAEAINSAASTSVAASGSSSSDSEH